MVLTWCLPGYPNLPRVHWGGQPMIACIKRMLSQCYKATLSADMSSDSDISLSDPTKSFVITDCSKENCNGQWLMSLVQAPHLKNLFLVHQNVCTFLTKNHVLIACSTVTIDLTCKYLSKISCSKVIISVFSSFPVSI